MKVAFFTHYATLTYKLVRSLLDLIEDVGPCGGQMLFAHPADGHAANLACKATLLQRNVHMMRLCLG